MLKPSISHLSRSGVGFGMGWWSKLNLTPVIEGTYDRAIDLNHEMNFMTSLQICGKAPLSPWDESHGYRITWQPYNESQGSHITSHMALAFLCPVSCNVFHEDRKPLKHLCICFLFRGCTPPPRLMQCLSLVGIGWVGWSKCQFPVIVKVPVRIAHYKSLWSNWMYHLCWGTFWVIS